MPKVEYLLKYCVFPESSGSALDGKLVLIRLHVEYELILSNGFYLVSNIPEYILVFIVVKLSFTSRTSWFWFQFVVRNAKLLIIAKFPLWFSVAKFWFDNRFWKTKFRLSVVTTPRSLGWRIAIDSEKESISPGQPPSRAEADQHWVASAASVETIGMKEAIVFPNDSWSICWSIKVSNSF